MPKNKRCEALPVFMGGKRKMVDIISSHFQGEALADVFMGGGSISLKAKERGMRVLANDIAYRSKITGEALIVNQKVKITEGDIYSLFVPAKNTGFIKRNFAPRYFLAVTAEFLDNAFARARKRETPKRELLELLLIKYIFLLKNFGSFQVGKVDQQMIADDKVSELIELSSSSRASTVHNTVSHPLPLLLKLKERINNGVFNNFCANEIYQMDVFDFLTKMAQEGKKIDTIYFDTPYKNTTEYSNHYKVLDQILEGTLDVSINDKAFNKRDAVKNFEKMFALSTFIPTWIISMGYNPDSEGGIKGEELLRVVQKFKEAEIYYLDHTWAINNLSGKSQRKNVEYLIVTK